VKSKWLHHVVVRGDNDVNVGFVEYSSFWCVEFICYHGHVGMDALARSSLTMKSFFCLLKTLIKMIIPNEHIQDFKVCTRDFPYAMH
jgi:hypothetical protein